MIVIKLAEMLGRRRMTQRDVCKLTGIRPNTVSLMWHGKIKRIDVKHLDKLCKALNCQVSDLLEYIPDEEPTE